MAFSQTLQQEHDRFARASKPLEIFTRSKLSLALIRLSQERGYFEPPSWQLNVTATCANIGAEAGGLRRTHT